MKRAVTVVIILATVILLLAGCESLPGGDVYEGRKLKETLSPRYTADIKLELGGLNVEAEIDNSSPGSCVITVTAPAHLSGYRWELLEDGALISYRGLSATLDPTGASASAPLLQTVSALSKLLRLGPDDLPIRENGLFTIPGETQTGEILLSFNEDDKPAKLSLGDGETEIILENFIFF